MTWFTQRRIFYNEYLLTSLRVIFFVKHSKLLTHLLNSYSIIQSYYICYFSSSMILTSAADTIINKKNFNAWQLALNCKIFKTEFYVEFYTVKRGKKPFNFIVKINYFMAINNKTFKDVIWLHRQWMMNAWIIILCDRGDFYWKLTYI